MTSYNIFHIDALHWLIALYFFLGGLAAGSFLLSVWAGYLNEKLKPLAKMAAIVAPISLAAGLALLLLDLGQPFKFWRLMVTFEPTAAASWGVWGANVFLVISIVYAWLWYQGKGDAAKKLGYIGVPFALLVGLYTGLLLNQLSGNALWDSALLAWIFLLGGVVSATAGNVLLATIAGVEPAEAFYGLKRAFCTLVILELLLVVTELLVLFNGNAESVSVANLLVSGDYAFWFIGLQVVVGSLVPLALIASAGKAASKGVQAVASVLLLVGILAVRFIVVMAGQVEL
ncbi:MAG: NrfD/PsrC family molybdoenzyme membrane anchor subunit [Planctomycetota bacterium]|jgi:formate-dependent nitrite reductase membrane component NrfD